MAWHGKELRSRIQACGKSQGTAVHSPALGLCLHCSTDPWCVPALLLQGSGAPRPAKGGISPSQPRHPLPGEQGARNTHGHSQILQ